MGAVECRSTRLCADSGRCCKRAIGAVKVDSHAGWWRSRSRPFRAGPGSMCGAGELETGSPAPSIHLRVLPQASTTTIGISWRVVRVGLGREESGSQDT
jgi:hypothetical protein